MADATLPIRFALSQQGKPYLWGGDGPDSYDCSGLMVAAFNTIGIHLPRTTQEMLADSSLMPVNVNQLQPGDLVFPSDEHVQMYLGGGKVVEAPRTGLNIRVTGLGKVYAARRVTNPSGNDFSGTPVSGVTPVSTTNQTGFGDFGASDMAQLFGKGLTDGTVQVLQPLLKLTAYGLLVLAGIVTFGTGMFLIYAHINKSFQ